MLEQILQSVPANQLALAIQQQPLLALAVIKQLKPFQLCGLALSELQQVEVSKHLNRFNDWLASENGKAAVGMMADDFIEFATAGHSKK